MKKYFTAAICLLLLIALSLSCRQQTENEVSVPLDCTDEQANEVDNSNRLFFIRHIDTLYNDTLYSVCYLSPDGDTIRTKREFHYENPDTTIWMNFYLRSNGDTIFCEDQSQLSLENSTGVVPNDSITTGARDVITEILQYLKDCEQIRSAKSQKSRSHE